MVRIGDRCISGVFSSSVVESMLVEGPLSLRIPGRHLGQREQMQAGTQHPQLYDLPTSHQHRFAHFKATQTKQLQVRVGLTGRQTCRV